MTSSIGCRETSSKNKVESYKQQAPKRKVCLSPPAKERRAKRKKVALVPTMVRLLGGYLRDQAAKQL